MLTDIFSQRYIERPIWTSVGAPELALLTQCFRVVREQVIPYNLDIGGIWHDHVAIWKALESKISMELGLEQLSPHSYNYMSGSQHVYGQYAFDLVVRAWMFKAFNAAEVSADRYMKVRISFIELAFREKTAHIEVLRQRAEKIIADAARSADLRQRATFRALGYDLDARAAAERQLVAAVEVKMSTYVDEVNQRFKQAGVPLSLHNNFIQIATDELIEEQVAIPFWKLVADPRFVNVDIDMKEAVDRREAGDRDPGFYAAKALESAIKVISNEKNWTRGSEKSANHYIDNLQSKANGGFVSGWEADALRHIFANVRNELGHGPGGEPMPQLTQQQTNWTIEAAMSWTKSLIERM